MSRHGSSGLYDIIDLYNIYTATPDTSTVYVYMCAGKLPPFGGRDRSP
jgi:hypothetical protein